MATQEEFFKSLGQARRSSDDPLPDFVKFPEMNTAHQGVVTDVYVTTEYDPSIRGPKKDKDGNDKPQLNVTIKKSDGTLWRIGFKGNMLFELRAVMGELDLSSVPIGALIGVAWTSNWEPPNGGYKAKQYTVKLKLQ